MATADAIVMLRIKGLLVRAIMLVALTSAFHPTRTSDYDPLRKLVHPHYPEAMMHPPSLSDDVKARAFRADNGELGILPADAPSFLAACRSDDVRVLGWELWVVDHSWDFETHAPVPAKGSWCGGIPVQGSDVLSVIGGEGEVDETERQLASTDLNAEVRPAWLPHVRVNFTLDT